MELTIRPQALSVFNSLLVHLALAERLNLLQQSEAYCFHSPWSHVPHGRSGDLAPFSASFAHARAFCFKSFNTGKIFWVYAVIIDLF